LYDPKPNPIPIPRNIRIADSADRADNPAMSNMKIVPLISAGDNAVRTEAQDAIDKLRYRVELLEEAAGQAMVRADRLYLGIDQLSQRITRLELAFSHELAVMQGRIAAVESEISELASLDGQKLQ